MGILEARKKKILEDGQITVAEADELVEAARKNGLSSKERDDLRTFFIRYESQLEPEARSYVEEALGTAARTLREKLESDGRVTEDEARFLIDEVRRGGISDAERHELHLLLVSRTSKLAPEARKAIEDALGIGVKVLPRSPSSRDDAELAPVREAVELTKGSKGKPTLHEVEFAGVKTNSIFVKDIAPRLKKFVAAGRSSLTADEAIALASGIAGGAGYAPGTEEPFLAGDRLEITVHYVDGEKKETQGIVVSAGLSPLVLFVNRKGFLQLTRQDPKSRDQITITKIVAGRQN